MVTEGQKRRRATALFRRQMEAMAKAFVGRRVTIPLRDARARFERAYVVWAIEACGGDREEAAERLAIGVSTLKEKIRRKP